ncbi:hypothetical protein [Vibrio methylphosphonaticus]|uniref:hypothetical protein n=1 Tax=Vibrio methylphosphonaticus TaxID=2946866 RepID=UPI002029EBF0|nr:hypothetical protein [Vibrio methylphosphonaticus]MCL9775824.1 hypothetical protein [Vibrio methylphosphonaticus]
MIFMYKFVVNKLDTQYCQAPPTDRKLNKADIPLEEIEMREMLSAWYDTAYQPLIKANNDDNDTRAESARLKKLETTLLVVLKNKAYQAAFERILTTTTASISKDRLLRLLMESKG